MSMPNPRYKLLSLGILAPLLSSALLALYLAWRTGSGGREIFLAWLVVGMISIAATLFVMRGHRTPTASGADREMPDNPQVTVSPRTTGPFAPDDSVLLTGPERRPELPINTILEMAPAGIIVTARDGTIKTFNPAAEKLFGCRAHEARGQNFTRFVPGALSNGQCVIVGGEHILEGVQGSGRRIPVTVRVSEMTLNGKPMYTCVVTDIAGRAHKETMLQEAQTRFQEMVETAHDLVWSLDAQGRWIYLNAATKSIYGHAPEDMLGHHVSEYQSPEYKDEGARALAKLMAGHELVHYEAVHVDRQGINHFLSFNGKAYFDAAGKIQHISGTARDITEQKLYQQQLYYQAQHDALTGLYNRNFFQMELDRLVAQVSRSGAECALFYIDLDQFKFINDTLGHAAGDRLLIEVTAMFTSQIREGDLLARFGGDEFTLLLSNIDIDKALQVADKLRVTIESYRFVEKGEAYNIGCSIGVAIIDNHAHSGEEVMSHADLACNLAKSQGRNRVVLYDPALGGEDGMAKDMGWAARVKDAVENDRFSLVFQPIISLRTGEVYGYEALLRMTHEDGSEILPRGFLPAAERFGLIHSVERWSVRHAIHHLARENKRLHTQFRFAINLSGRAFGDEGLLPVIEQALRSTGLDPFLLTFEITETAAITNITVVTEFVRKLKRLGCQFALDDFGSGFSSFAYLKQLQVDKVKIDGVFIRRLANDDIDHALVKAITSLAHTLGLETIASGVEDEQTLRLLEQHGVDYAQGYYLGRPTPDLGQGQFNFLQSGCKLA
ncbi:MAG: hypothetical protein A2V90_06765 [Gammaproteobacteria bacterium RBG_16_57_12]|nr:MAG: hypothetical protein A2V90_06765 [Gammaproteobacteria bacterium RBG_16_57_12]